MAVVLVGALLLCVVLGFLLGGRGLVFGIGAINLLLALNTWRAAGTFDEDLLIDRGEEAWVLFIGIGLTCAVMALIVYRALSAARLLPKHRKARAG
ncbi:hypothetical protein AL073_00555 [Loktanella sp. 1ANDIMAR09]|nr:hypothetical protein AL073_00555 [Loktanella sp. 1ANDIMAR09]